MPVSPVITTYESHRDILASSNYVASSYTLDANYVALQTLADGTTAKVLWEGTIVAVDPSNSKVVPNYTAYGFGELGPLLQVAYADNGDTEVAVVFRGDVVEAYCSDDGTFGTVLAATKTALADRIQFTAQTRL
jgi:hypothetical protein